jgi:type VI secretion system protein ImpA
MAIDPAELLQPITGADPCGEDVSFSDAFDQIREARRADDASLSQGDWQTELKSADWRAALTLATKVLTDQSKDLQAAVWLGEALIARHGFAGAADAFDVLHGLMDTYWDGLYPLPDGDDLEERASKLAWFNTWAALGLKKTPLSAGGPIVTLVDWQTSREVDNLARQNAAAYQEALGEGKPTGEMFDRAVDGSGADFIREMIAAIEAAQTSFARLQSLVDARLGKQSPSLADIDDALKRARQVVVRAAQNVGIAAPSTASAMNESTANDSAAASRPASANTGAASVAAIFSTGMPPLPAPDTQSRAQLLRAISDIAAHFKRVEPHSPVSFLLDRAVMWADMPLDQWLSEVVGDDTVLGTIRDRIGVAR